MEITIRPIAPDDFEDCGRICYEGFKIVNEQHGFPPQFPSVEAGVRRINSLSNAPASFGVVAELAGKIAGFAFLTERDPVRAIGPIVIDLDVQSRGIGRKIHLQLEPNVGHRDGHMTDRSHFSKALIVFSRG